MRTKSKDEDRLILSIGLAVLIFVLLLTNPDGRYTEQYILVHAREYITTPTKVPADIEPVYP